MLAKLSEKTTFQKIITLCKLSNRGFREIVLSEALYLSRQPSHSYPIFLSYLAFISSCLEHRPPSRNETILMSFLRFHLCFCGIYHFVTSRWKFKSFLSKYLNMWHLRPHPSCFYTLTFRVSARYLCTSN